MATILRFDGWRVVIYANDHRPPHVHVIGNDAEAVFRLNCPHGPPEPVRIAGLAHHALAQIRKRLESHTHLLCLHWSMIHDDT
ncbi:hypothetical protein CDEN61S_02462 [Castellaniella denitrificans]|uniref:DUF4160 domain-containing protein n=1 Tax=Castellaniella sp. TaxID=1955812 RepID=UPI002AFEDEA2|nr:DUF4160 domain-containing protein [Castellaniella sp.]